MQSTQPYGFAVQIFFLSIDLIGMLIFFRTVAHSMPDEKSQEKLLSEAKKIIKDIQEEVIRLKKQGKLEPRMNKALNRIKKDTKNLMEDISRIVFRQTKLDDFK